MVKDDAIEELLGEVRHSSVKLIYLWFTDIHGNVKNIELPIDQLRDALEHGVWFDGSSIQGFSRIEESDSFLKPDIDTFQVLPWKVGNKKVGRFICDVKTSDEEPFDGDPRRVLKRQTERAQNMGLTYYVGPEPECFFFTEEGKPQDEAGYFDLSGDEGKELRAKIIEWLEALDITVEAAHHEVAIGQHEIDIEYDDALSMADKVITYKFVVEEAARRMGLKATFMPKPLPGRNGSGMHTHQSLFRNGENVFFDEDGKHFQLSDTALAFLSGQLRHARGLAAVVAPTVNSYKRLVPGYEAPVYVCWGQTNRSALVRVPRFVRGKEQSCRLELRCPDPSANPYLAFAVMLAAGLDGIENEYDLDDPIENNAYERKDIPTLPGSLWEAVQALQEDEVVLEALGPHIREKFIEGKTAEWREFSNQVTAWEMERYL